MRKTMKYEEPDMMFVVLEDSDVIQTSELNDGITGPGGSGTLPSITNVPVDEN